MHSVRNYLILTILGSIALVVTISAVFVELLLKRNMQELFDNALRDKASAMMALIENDSEGIEFEFAGELMPEFEHPTNPQYFQIWIDDEVVFERSHSLKDANLTHENTELNSIKIQDVILPDGRPGRSAQAYFLLRQDGDEGEVDDRGIEESVFLQEYTGVDSALYEGSKYVKFSIARERESYETLIFQVRAIILISLMGILIVIAFVIIKLVGKALLPLVDLADQIQLIDDPSSQQRIVIHGFRSREIVLIENQVNELLNRIASIMEREKIFSSNVAHELRTPLAELRTLSEIGAKTPVNLGRVLPFFKDVQDIALQMEKIVTALLQITRSEAGMLNISISRGRLSSFIDSAWLRAKRWSSKNHTFDNHISHNILLDTDCEKLEIIINNLFDNANEYSPDDSIIRVSVEQKGQFSDIKIQNPANDIESTDVSLMGDKFWRKEQSRSDSTHAGLGLSLADILAKQLGYNLDFYLDENRLMNVTLSGLSTTTE